MAYTKYSLTPANNNAAPPDGAPEGMLPSAVNDTMRDMMAQIRDCGDGIRGGTYTMTAPVITGGSINGTTVGASTASTGAFTTLAYTGTLTGGTGVVNLGSGQFYKDASGNVGLGTASPTVYAANDKVLQLSSGANGGAIRISNTATGTNGGWLGYQLGLDSYLSNVSAGALVFATSNQEKMRIDSSGNVGLGTSTPSTGTLNRQLTINSGASNLAGIVLQNNGTGTSFSDGTYLSLLNTVDFGIINQESGAMSFGTSNLERMRIDSSGNLCVGITGTLNDGRVVSRTPSGSTGYGFRSDAVNAAGTTFGHFYGTSSTNSVANIIIYGNGNIVNANNSYGALSDIKNKENIVDATPKLDKLLQVKVRNYNLKGDYEQHKQIGVVAQELEEVFPSLVEETIDRDADGKDAGTTTKSVKYSVFVPMLIKAMQEQQAMIENLTTRLNALEGN